MSRRGDLLQLTAARQAREQQAGVKMGYGENAYSASSTRWISPRVPIGEDDFSIEFYGNFYGSATAGINGISNIAQPGYYEKGCLMMYATILGYNRLGWILFEGNAEADGLEVQHVESDFQKKFHLVLTRSGRTVKAYINGVLEVTKEQSSVKDFPEFRLGLANSSDIGLARIFSYALSDTEIAALYNNGMPEEYVLPTWMKTMKNSYQSDFTSGVDGWAGLLSSSVELENEALNIISSTQDYTINRTHNGAFAGHSKYKVEVEFAEPTKGTIRQFYYYPFSVANALVLDNVPAGTTSIKGVANLFYSNESNANHYLYLIGVDTPQTFRIRSIKVTPVGCMAEYLPQNITPDTWLDSARQLPMNDEYLPPLLEPAGDYDLEASGMPELTYKNR